MYWCFWKGYNRYNTSNLQNGTGTLALPSILDKKVIKLAHQSLTFQTIKKSKLSFKDFIFNKQISSLLILEWYLFERVFANLAYFLN